jgi:hypothetical protein
MSSTLDLSTLSLTDLLAERSRIDTEIGVKTGGVGAVASSSGKKSKKEKKQSKRAGKPTPYGDFSKKVQAEQKDAITAFKEANPDVKGAHLAFVGNYKKEHYEEYKAFEAAWKEAHPKSEEPAEAKPKKVLSPEHLAKLKAGREAKKALKDAEKAAAEAAARGEAPVAPLTPEKPAKEQKAPKAPKKATKAAEVVVPVLAPVAEEAEDEELPFKLGAQTYVRYGHKGADGETVWASGDLWLSKKGAKGAYAGELQEDGSINTDADEPELA